MIPLESNEQFVLTVPDPAHQWADVYLLEMPNMIPFTNSSET